jgi:hypothetical protein
VSIELLHTLRTVCGLWFVKAWRLGVCRVVV